MDLVDEPPVALNAPGLERPHASRVITRVRATVIALAFAAAGPPAGAQSPDTAVVTVGDSVIVRLVEVDVRTAVHALSRFLDRPVTFGALTETRLTVETPRPVHRTSIPQLLVGILEAHDLELLADTVAGLYRVQRRVVERASQRRAESDAPPRVTEEQSIQLFVVRLSHARAADVAATVNALYGRASALGEIGERGPTLGQVLRQSRVPPAGVAPPGLRPPPAPVPQAPPNQGAHVAGLAQGTIAGEVVIVPDEGTNSLLIRASESDFELIRAAVEQVDVRPLQVLIEVLIAEVRRDRRFSFGVEGILGTTPVPGTSNTTVSASTSGLGLGDFALKVMGIGGHDVDATLRAAASRGEVTIVSRPILLAANNEPAEILVGSQRPFVQVSRSLPTDAPQRDQVIQYRDVGTQLNVRPTISADGYVMLEVTQEVNAATTEVQFDAPVISTRSVSTRLLVKDGQTIVLGGLTDRQRDRNQGGVPLLSSIPLVGGLFGRATRNSNETELFLFITPRVIRSDEDVEALTTPWRRRAGEVKP